MSSAPPPLPSPPPPPDGAASRSLPWRPPSPSRPRLRPPPARRRIRRENAGRLRTRQQPRSNSLPAPISTGPWSWSLPPAPKSFTKPPAVKPPISRCFRNYSTPARLLSRAPRPRGRHRRRQPGRVPRGRPDLLRLDRRRTDRPTAISPKPRRPPPWSARWRDAPPEACLGSRSVEFLKRTGRTTDLDFILSHIDDLPRRLRRSPRRGAQDSAKGIPRPSASRAVECERVAREEPP